MSESTRPDATAVRAAILGGETNARATAEACLARIASDDPSVRAFAEVTGERALARAEELDRERARGLPCGPLHGVPLAIKSNMCLEDVETNCGSRLLAGYRPPYTATFVQRALDAGCVPVGTAHMDEFAMGSSGENSAYASSRNPWDIERAPGGSSSGSAAAVAAGMVPLALGSDTGGSVRQPASFCGISGFKPTYGRVSRFGLVAFGSSLDQVAPLARSVRDLELLLAAIEGPDPLDGTTLPAAVTARGDEHSVSRSSSGAPLEGVRIGIPDEYFPDELDQQVRAEIDRAIAQLQHLGATCTPVGLPHVSHALSAYYVVATAEASSNLARFDGVRFGARVDGDGSLESMMSATRTAGFGTEVKRRILLGTYVLQKGYQDAWYRRATAVRSKLRAEFAGAFDTVDLLLGPTAPSPAFKLGEKASDPVAMYLSDILTVPASLAGIPAISIPCGFTGDQALPVGLQLMGAAGADRDVLSTARIYQEATDFHLTAPRLDRGPDAS